VALLAGCSRPTAGSRAVPTVEAHYIDSAKCAVCHREIAESYRTTGMGRSFSSAVPVEGKLYHPASDRYYEITGVRMLRYQVGPAGRQVTYDRLRDRIRQSREDLRPQECRRVAQ
jgi:hypothetical protein